MPESWRDVVAQLDPDADLSEGIDPLDGMVVARLERPGSLFRIPGIDPDDAWRRVATALADTLLVESLEAAGWVLIEEVIDQDTYVVALDPAGTVWAIGVASDEYGRGYLEPDMRRDDRAERLAFVHLIETRSPEALMAALAEEV